MATSASRTKFGNQQDWQDYVASKTDADGNIAINPHDLRALRNACYADIAAMRGRPLLVYAANFISNLPPNAPISIDLQDVDGFTDLINTIPADIKEIDVLVHSPGGAPDATQRVVNLLRPRFDKVNFLIPHSAYSAATMLSMSGNSVILHPSAVLGPIDPQMSGVPARQIKRAFTNLQQKVIDGGQESIIVYLPLIEKYSLHLLEACDDAEKLSKTLVKDWLKKYMLAAEPTRQRNSIATKATDYMADFDRHLMHSLPLDIAKLKRYGIKVDYADDNLSKLLREAHILIKATFDGFGFVKLYESPGYLSWGIQISQAS